MNDRALGQTDAEGELQLDAESIRMIADLLDRRFVRERRGRKRHHRPRELDRAEVVEKLDRRELVAADAAVDRAELDAGRGLRAEDSGEMKGCGCRSEEESASIEYGIMAYCMTRASRSQQDQLPTIQRSNVPTESRSNNGVKAARSWLVRPHFTPFFEWLSCLGSLDRW